MKERKSRLIKTGVYIICGTLITVPHIAYSVLATMMYMYGELTQTFMLTLVAMWLCWAVGITGLAVLAFGKKTISDGWSQAISSKS